MDLEAYKQLPIPAWLALSCPRCDYPLCGLPEHRCPECGTAVDLDVMVQNTAVPLRPPEITPATRPVPPLELECAECGQFLDGATGGECPHCGAPFDLTDFVPEENWITVACRMQSYEVQLLLTVLRAAGIPCMISRSGLQEDLVGAAVGVSDDLRVRRDYYLDAMMAMHETRQTAGASWICPDCGEKVPGNFEICWKCDLSRDEEATDE